MTYLELYQLFLIFLESEGALDKYQAGMNQPVTVRWAIRGGGEFTPRLNLPHTWIDSAFAWESHGGTVYWRGVKTKWNALARLIRETHQLG